MIQELIVGVPNQYDLIVRGRLVAWTEDIEADIYSFKKTGSGLDEDDDSPPPVQSTPTCKMLTRAAKLTDKTTIRILIWFWFHPGSGYNSSN